MNDDELTIMMVMMTMDANVVTGSRGPSRHGRLWDESVTQDAVRSVRG